MTDSSERSSEQLEAALREALYELDDAERALRAARKLVTDALRRVEQLD